MLSKCSQLWVCTCKKRILKLFSYKKAQEILMIRETEMFSMSRYVSVLCFANTNLFSAILCLVKDMGTKQCVTCCRKMGNWDLNCSCSCGFPANKGLFIKTWCKETKTTVILCLATAQYLHNIWWNYAHTILCFSHYILHNTSLPGYSWIVVQSALFIRRNEAELYCLLFPNRKSTLESSHLITSLIGLISNRPGSILLFTVHYKQNTSV